MPLETVKIAVLVSLSALVIVLWVRRRVQERKLRALFAQASKALDANLAETTADRAALVEELERVRQEAERQRKRADEFFELIEGVTRERDERMRLYYEQSTEHGAAQALLLRQIESLVRQYQAVAPHRAPKLNQAVETVVREFHERHVAPQQAAQQAAQQAPIEDAKASPGG